MKTILLDIENWDMVIDASGNIAVASDPYSLAQDAASEIRLFKGEFYYDTIQGIPYWQQILGKFPPVSLMKAKFIAAALKVPQVVRAKCYLRAITKRQVSGQVQTIDANDRISVVNF